MRKILCSVFSCLIVGPVYAQVVSPEEGRATSGKLAEEARQQFAGMSFEEFKAQIPYFEDLNLWVVNGDVPIRGEKRLREFFEANIQVVPPTGDKVPELIVANEGGLDLLWGNAQRRALTYCVDTGFGPNYTAMVADMAGAAAAWEAAADIDFIHVAAEDSACTSSNNNVLFDVRPFDFGGQFLAVAFLPNEARSGRTVAMDPSSFTLDPNRALTLRGILRHELGHVLGFRHEHTRPDAGACFEDLDWREVTDYDALSVMHYPHCNGQGDFSLTLTHSDMNGIACLYGPAPGFVIDTAICTPAVLGGSGQPTTLSEGPVAVAQGESVSFGPFDVAGGTRFVVRQSGEGDPDLYLKFDALAALSVFDCRPFVDGPDEVCDVDVPMNASVASVMVHGFADARFSLDLSFVAP